MRKFGSSFTLVVTCCIVLGVARHATAGLIVLSGDANIANALDGSGDVSLDTDNQQFFRNVLGTGTRVVVESSTGLGSPSVAAADRAVNTFYSGIAGVTSSLVVGPIRARNLAGANLFVSIMPDDAYVASEIAAFSRFLAGGGTMFLMGDRFVFPTQNGFLNALLLGLGSTMSIVDGDEDGATPLADPLTEGVGPIQFIAGSSVSGGTMLFNSITGAPVIVRQTVTPTVPEPATLVLSWLGLVAVGVRRRRRG